MRALFFVEPLIMHSRPFHYWAWLSLFADMARALEAGGGRAHFLLNDALVQRALSPESSAGDPVRRGHGFTREQVSVLRQENIRRHFQLPNVAIVEALHRGHAEGLAAYAELIRSSLGAFSPDVMLSLTPAPQLQQAFPGVPLLYSETAAFSRSPYPLAVFFDPRGMWDQSVIASAASELFRREPLPEEREFLTHFRARFAAYFRARSPFGPLEAELRQRYRRLAFLPLQFGGEPGFDVNAPFRTQGEYLFHVLESLPKDVGLIAVEHPTAHFVGDVIDAETREYLALRHPNLTFVDFRAAPSAGQHLLHHVDFVIAVSTSLAFQGLLFGKPLVSVGTSHLRAWASLRGLDALTEDIPPPPAGVDAGLAWLLSHYFVPRAKLTDPEYMAALLSRAGRAGLDFFEPVASHDELERLWFSELDQLGAPLRAELRNGRFEDWRADGPPGWELIELGAGVSELSPLSTGGARLARLRNGGDLTLLLQRVPDATRAAGTLGKLAFSARADTPTTLLAYFYLQPGGGAPGVGTEPGAFVIGSDWREHQYLARLPDLAPGTTRPGHHLEVVLALPAEAGLASVELRDVRLQPVRS